MVLSLHTYVLQLFGYVQSEALYLPLALGALLFLGRWAAGNRRHHLVLFTGLAAVACLARMIGISLALVGVIAVLVWSTDAISRRLLRAAAVGAGVLGPLALFTLYENVKAGSGNHRPLSFHPPGTYDLRPTLDSLTRWVLPTDPSGALSSSHRWIVGIALAGVVLLVAWLAWSSRAERGVDTEVALEARRLLSVLAIAVACYLVVLVASRTVTDNSASFQFGGRLLVPALPLAWLILAGVVAQWAAHEPSPVRGQRVVAIVGVVGLLLGVAHLSRTTDVLGWDGGAGVNPTAVVSPTPGAVERLVTPGAVVATNAPNRIWHDTGIDTISVPSARFGLSGEKNPHLDRDIAELRAIARAARRSGRLPGRQLPHDPAPRARGGAGEAGRPAGGRPHRGRPDLPAREMKRSGRRAAGCVKIAG